MKKLIAFTLVIMLVAAMFVGCANAEKSVSSAVDAVGSEAGELVDDAQSAVSDLVDGAEDKVTDVASDVAGAASDVVSGAVGMTDEARAEAEALAKQAGALLITEEELAAFDGKDDNKAYIAVNGIIYDVTDAPDWDDGEHKGFTVGKNVADGTAAAVYDAAVLVELPIVGMIKA